MAQSKIEGTDYENFIREELFNGTTYRELERIMKDKGISLTHVTIRSYHLNKMGGERADTGGEAIPLDELKKNQTKVEFADISENEELESLKRSRSMIVQSIEQKIKEGKGKMPDSDARMLNTVLGAIERYEAALSKERPQTE